MSDQVNRNLVAGALALIGILSVVGGVVLVMGDKTVPDFLVATGSGSIGALAGVLLPGRSSS